MDKLTYKDILQFVEMIEDVDRESEKLSSRRHYLIKKFLQFCEEERSVIRASVAARHGTNGEKTNG